MLISVSSGCNIIFKLQREVGCWCNVLFSSARIGKALNVDRVPPLNDGPQHGTQFGSSSDDLQAFIDEFDLMITNQDAMQL